MDGGSLGSALTRPARLAIVGHTNAGKTSLIRTLTRDTGFGAVSPEASTTKHVEKVRLVADGIPVVDLYDTPGMEEPISLRDLIKRIEMNSADRPDGPALIERFLATDEARGEFEQEAKVVRQLLASDAGLYVVDTRDPVLPKFQHELDILRLCGKPLVAVLNFVSMPTNRAEEWRAVLRRVGLHVHVSFDAVAPERKAEETLYSGLTLQLDEFRSNFLRLVGCRQKEVDERHKAAIQNLADLMIDLAAASIEFPREQEKASPEKIAELSYKVIQRERQAVARLLEIYQFGPDDLLEENIPLRDGYWEDDPFDRKRLEKLGIEVAGGVGKGAAGGAAAGAVFDATVGGISMGAGLLIGAAIGGGTVVFRDRYEDLRRMTSGKKRIVVDDLVLLVVILRGLYLIERLEMRGHGAVLPMNEGDEFGDKNAAMKLPDTLPKARRNPSWSRLNSEPTDEVARQRELSRLCDDLGEPGPSATPDPLGRIMNKLTRWQ